MFRTYYLHLLILCRARILQGDFSVTSLEPSAKGAALRVPVVMRFPDGSPFRGSLTATTPATHHILPTCSNRDARHSAHLPDVSPP